MVACRQAIDRGAVSPEIAPLALPATPGYHHVNRCPPAYPPPITASIQPATASPRVHASPAASFAASPCAACKDACESCKEIVEALSCCSCVSRVASDRSSNPCNLAELACESLIACAESLICCACSSESACKLSIFGCSACVLNTKESICVNSRLERVSGCANGLSAGVELGSEVCACKIVEVAHSSKAHSSAHE